MHTTFTPTAEAILESIREALIDLAEELRQDYDDVEICLNVSATNATADSQCTGRLLSRSRHV
ncbi:MAG: hypothetical protein K6T81_16335 [Alicyclobacillus macrosporangiidus]|uniref:hypothetical protein n=1 Tax=Alicyclobacillus macrosporangiidus TaxID=392015 RepID=UPI0026EE0306|nr:hypothetical protein [Alicyclobacillus macrosporangiidus]MCL6600283.1 hypothetical protein [Alicyclobacillus macrosporangiidus]